MVILDSAFKFSLLSWVQKKMLNLFTNHDYYLLHPLALKIFLFTPLITYAVPPFSHLFFYLQISNIITHIIIVYFTTLGPRRRHRRHRTTSWTLNVILSDIGTVGNTYTYRITADVRVIFNRRRRHDREYFIIKLL